MVSSPKSKKQVSWLSHLNPNSPSAGGIPILEQVRHFILSRFTPEFPLLVDVQTKDGCNASCTFCPSGKPFLKVKHGTMEDWVFQKIVDEASRHTVLRFAPFLMNEPLRDDDIFERVAYARRKMPWYTQIRLISNGALLTEDTAYKLIHAGLDKLIISVQSIDQEIYEETMVGLDYEVTMENVMRFVDLKKRLRMRNPDFEIWMVRTQLVENRLKEHKKYWKDLNIKFKTRRLNNQADPQLEARMDDLNPTEWRYANHCAIPFWRFWVIWNGDVVVCCADWHRTTVMGNIKDQSIEQIWNNKLYREHRERMLSGETEGLICHDCKGVA